MSETTKAFDLGDILSVTTGFLVSPRHIGGVYDILGFMTGEQLFTHQLPAACRECEPLLLAQHPQLADIDIGKFEGEAHVKTWLSEMKAKYGETLPISRITERNARYSDPIGDLRRAAPNTRVIVVNPESLPQAGTKH
jgi:hypothetical protein